jgi:hypothetical protein
MTKNSFIAGKNQFIKLLAAICLSFLAPLLSAQSLPDFSGTWIQDKNKSDEFYKAFNVTCTITQTQQSFNVKTSFSDDSGSEPVMRESTFALDGKETTDKEGTKKSAKWSADKKTLTTSDIRNYGGDNVGVLTSYSISTDGLVLTVKTSDIRPDGLKITQVFNRKK